MVKFTVLFVVAIVAMTASLAFYQNSITNTLYHNQLQSCERGNTLRTESNNRLKAHLVDRDNLIKFADGARVARLAAYEDMRKPSDLEAARVYAGIIASQKKNVTFTVQPLLNCKQAVEHP